MYEHKISLHQKKKERSDGFSLTVIDGSVNSYICYPEPGGLLFDAVQLSWLVVFWFGTG